jgi:hypothetical protein
MGRIKNLLTRSKLPYEDLQTFLSPHRGTKGFSLHSLLSLFGQGFKRSKIVLSEGGKTIFIKIAASGAFLLSMRDRFPKVFPTLKSGELRRRLAREVRLLIPNIWKSIFRHPFPVTEKDQVRISPNHFFVHRHPPRVKRHGLQFTYTCGVGGLSLLLFIIETVTGGFLMLYYIPSTEKAYSSYKDMLFTASFARLMQNLHHWAGHGMILAVFFHMCRVFYTGAYKKPREFNWAVGVFLFILTLALSYTGYLLPWDQLAFWAITVGSRSHKQLPGRRAGEIFTSRRNMVGKGALIRFYVLHVFILPLIAGILVAIHFWRIRRMANLWPSFGKSRRG